MGIAEAVPRGLLALLLAALFCMNAAAGERKALVIGNAAYLGTPLVNPVNDARSISAALSGLGFEVRTVTDADRRAMERAMIEFSATLDENTTALFYYAGHGGSRAAAATCCRSMPGSNPRQACVLKASMSAR